MKINLTTLGCPKNIVDSEILLGGLKGEDIEIVEDPLEAETIILNTCGFIQGAKEESIDAILQAVELKKRGDCKRVFVTGCLSQRYQAELIKDIPEVDGYYGNRDMVEVLRKLLNRLDLKRDLLGERALTTPTHYAYLKISEGCENPCTFCSIPGIRGKFKSRSIESLVDEAQMLAAKGVQELILIAQDTTIYGMDLYGEKKLVPLLDRLSQNKKFKWIRLLYTYPAHFSEDLIEIIVDRKQVFKYIDMPIQHASDRILKRMARKVTRKDIERIIALLRKGNPDIALRTSLIVGFPGETKEEHREMADFMEDIRFERLGLFTYSREEDTPAYNLPDQLPDHIKRERWAELNDIQTELSFELNRSCVGTVKDVLIDEFDNERNAYIGRTASDCPEIDNSVIIEETKELEIGKFYRVKFTDFSDYDLKGECVP
ncbi:30S ribosomal protein S12 methylthiotransferase RimO [candidate division KSB1 bacterium]|nr:30S ribosomal protein S12 methylthiotransferase RimO [candidate division KSB1 bacterium]TDI97326.1 MAG: 30S ribosomal protein S12 methylthiotransferase RimO [Caldithrix sp.]